MRRSASFLLLLLALPAMATDAWRWKDADGVVHYSDHPVPGAEHIELRSAVNTGSATASPPSNVSAAPERTEPATVPYQSCAVSVPGQDEVFDSVSSVPVLLDVQPALQTGHRVQVFLNGQMDTDWPAGVLAYTLNNLYRGSYTLQARIVDAAGRLVCKGSSITFHVRQPSLLAPGRKKAGG